MNKKNKSFELNEKSLNEEIRKRRREWSERKAYIEGLLEEPVRLAREDPASGIGALYTLTEAGRRLYRRYLRSRFGYKVWGFDYSFLIWGILYPERFIRPERLPSNAGEANCFTSGLTEWVAWEMAWLSIHKIANTSSSLNNEAFQAMHKKCLFSLVDNFDVWRIRLVLSNSYANKRLDEAVGAELSIAWLSSWVGAQISLQRNLRLKYSLEKEGYSPFSKLLQELPATTLIESDNLVEEEEGPTKLVSRVAKHLANKGSGTPELARDEELASSDLAGVTIAEPMLEAFSAKEKLEALRASTKLTKREDQVLELMLKDQLDREIASNLGIVEGAVKTLKFRVREKLKGAAG